MNPFLPSANSKHLLPVGREEYRTSAVGNVDQEKDERALTVSQRTLAAERQLSANYLKVRDLLDRSSAGVSGWLSAGLVCGSPVADDLHQPNTVDHSDSTLCTGFDANKFDDRGRSWPFVGGIHWSRNYCGHYGPILQVTKPGEKFNSKRPDNSLE